jgi:hypothetical protein
MAATTLARETLRSIMEHNLAAHNAELRGLLLVIDSPHETLGKRSATRRIEEIVAPFRAFHQEYPLSVLPRDLLQRGPVRTGLRQKADDTELSLSYEDLSLSAILPGPTGVGKSTAARHVAYGARSAGVQLIIIDPKPERGFRALAASDPDFLIIDRDAPFNLIGRDESLSVDEQIALEVETGADALYAAEDYRQIMNPAYRNAHAHHTNPTMRDVVEEIRKLQSKGETYKFRDAQRGAELRHTRLIERYPGMCTSGGAPPSALFEYSLYLPLPMSNIEVFIITYLLRRLVAWNTWRQTCTS